MNHISPVSGNPCDSISTELALEPDYRVDIGGASPPPAALLHWRARARGTSGGLAAVLHGELAAILTLASLPVQKQKLPRTGVPGSRVSVVAGTRFELMTFRL